MYRKDMESGGEKKELERMGGYGKGKRYAVCRRQCVENSMQYEVCSMQKAENRTQ
jgi:hypothetical protein